MTDVGRFVWYELESTQPDEAVRFYTELIGWSIQEFPMGDTSYKMIANEGTPIGGFGSLQDSSEDARWTSWSYVTDLEATHRKAESLGAKVIVPATQIPPGSFSVIEDPQGARLTLFQQNDAPAAKQEGPAPHGSFGWTELHTTDASKGTQFYADLLGYSIVEFPMGGPEPYRILRIGERDEAGAASMGPDASFGPGWLPYISVDDIDARHAKAESLGATTLSPPTDIPNVGRFSIIADPVGGKIAIMRFGD